MRLALWLLVTLAAALTAVVAPACRQAPPPPGTPVPIYNKDTGQLEQLVSDRNGDGKPDTWAFMQGSRIVRIELDRTGDGRPDRWEFYSDPTPDGRPTVIVRAEEANGPDGRTVTRHERYRDGVVEAVDEDTDGDGRPDKWEIYGNGRLRRVELDLAGLGRPTRRLDYGADGRVTASEIDARSTGKVTAEQGR